MNCRKPSAVARLDARCEARRRPLGRFPHVPPLLRRLPLSQRLNAKQVQMWLGHHSPAFTLATYVRLLPEDLPGADFLDSLTSSESEVAAGHQNAVESDRYNSFLESRPPSVPGSAQAGSMRAGQRDRFGS